DILSIVMERAELPQARVTIPKMLEPISIQGITIVPFEGLHWEKQLDDADKPLRGVPSVGYRVEFNNKRWLFPGDTRSYDACLLPDFGPVDGVFAHVWLGREAALLGHPPLLEDFCRFYLDLSPNRLVLAHLEESGRDANDYWDDGHASIVMRRWREIAPGIPVIASYMGDSVGL
ncbi:MAG: hypothetical protein EHM70_24665, partial [Chloroflexota bacterium]